MRMRRCACVRWRATWLRACVKYACRAATCVMACYVATSLARQRWQCKNSDFGDRWSAGFMMKALWSRNETFRCFSKPRLNKPPIGRVAMLANRRILLWWEWLGAAGWQSDGVGRAQCPD